MARTTLRLDDTQMVRLKNLARAQGRTMTDLINEFIAEGLAAEQLRNLNKRLTCVASADKDFAKFSSLEVINPSRPA
jgi:hypothetical protein